MKASLGSLQAAVAQLKTAVVALELRPPLGDAAQDSASCLQWLQRAREALKREVADIRQQHVALQADLGSAVAVAAAAPQSPQKALATQVRHACAAVAKVAAPRGSCLSKGPAVLVHTWLQHEARPLRAAPAAGAELHVVQHAR